MCKLNFEEAKKRTLRDYLNEECVKRIANMKLAKDWKWGVAERQFNEGINFDLFKNYLQTPEPKEHKFSSKVKTEIEIYLINYVYRNFSFGRKRNRDRGDNSPLEILSGNLQHENIFEYRGSFKGYTGSDLCPDFAVIFHRTKPDMKYRFPWMNKPVNIQFDLSNDDNDQLAELRYHFENSETFTTCINTRKYSKGEKIVRLSNIDFKGLPISWNENEKAFEHTEYGLYHVSYLWNYESRIWNDRLNIIKSFKQRRDTKIRQKELQEKASKVFVTKQDSIEAGNCKIETNRFAKKVKEKFYDSKPELEEINLRGDQLLYLRNDNFTQRAVQQAIKRTFSK